MKLHPFVCTVCLLFALSACGQQEAKEFGSTEDFLSETITTPAGDRIILQYPEELKDQIPSLDPQQIIEDHQLKDGEAITIWEIGGTD